MKIRINNQETETHWQFYQELKQSVAPETVMIVNGFQTEEDRLIEEGDQFFFIDKRKLPEKDQLEALMAARHTPFVHEKLKLGRVTIIGLGGLGSNIAVMLARIGVGYLRLIDFDVVDASNLNRQHYHAGHIGRLKTDALAEQIAAINPFISVECLTESITEDNFAALTADTDIICEAVDRANIKSLIIENGLLKTTQYLVSASGMAGTETANSIQTKRLNSRLYLAGDGESGAQIGRGLMAPRVNVCAGHQANMILRLLIGEEEA